MHFNNPKNNIFFLHCYVSWLYFAWILYSMLMTNQWTLKFYKNGYAYNNDLSDEMTVSSASQSINHYHNFYIFKINENEKKYNCINCKKWESMNNAVLWCMWSCNWWRTCWIGFDLKSSVDLWKYLKANKTIDSYDVLYV